MNQIRAFVGHSFTDDDAEVVSKFLKYFSQLKRSHPAFSWEHAEPAEPKVLAEKVLSLLSDKNVFIGICTRKERVIAPLRLKTVLPGLLMARANEFEWKTSDWIIQEIGLVQGRNMDLILLLESGIRQPGGLQGNVEYIHFDRDAPEKCFGKILEMIAALSPKPSGLTSFEGGTAPPISEEDQHKEEKGDRGDEKGTAPKPEWKRHQYVFALMRATARDETALAEQIHAAYLETEWGAQPQDAESWEALGVLARVVYGKGGSLAQLKEMANRWPDNSEVLRYLARAYEHYGQHEDAANTFETASSKETDLDTRLRDLHDSAGAYQKAGKGALAGKIVSSMRAICENERNGKRVVLMAQRDLAEASGDKELVLATLERIVELEPDDEDSRFALAYKHSELGNEAMALYHYSRIPERERNEVTWNNLGAACDQLALPAKSVDAYRMAEDMGNTLAMSNLAHKLMKAGFLSEAKVICDRALATPDFHQNVGHALSRLMELPEEEREKEQAALDKARPISEFYGDLGRAAVRPEPPSISGKWKGPDGLLEASFLDSTLTMVGEREVRVGLLAALLEPRSDAPGTSEPPQRMRVEYRAKSTGRAFVGTVTRRRLGGVTTSALAAGANEPKVLIALSDDGQELDVMEKVAGEDVRRYKYLRMSDS